MDKPNDHTPRPNKSAAQAENLPNETKGRIQDILKDPAIAAKRKARHAEAMKGNRNAFKHGEYATNPFTQALKERLDSYAELNFEDNPEHIKAAMRSMIMVNLKRIALFELQELMMHDTKIDPALTKLVRDTHTMLGSLHSLENTVHRRY